MPKLKDSKGVFHKSYASLHKAEMDYAREAEKEAQKETIIERVVKQYEGESEVERARRLHLKLPEPEADKIEDDSIIITEAKRKKKVLPREFYCLNCGEDVAKSDVVCPTCGIPLDWRNL